ncbi:MAG TPA: alpha/beta hydrolase-fold protein [Candidatus Acidoferrales bacterium]|nr:alpha/beta hydrolase-fold protein [Candidatus Acidoferrales bacterium]
MRILIALLGFGLAARAFQPGQPAAAAAIMQNITHPSQVFDATREYQVVLPPAYPSSQKRYPVIYWFNGYEHPSDEIALQIAAFVASHDVIVVRAGPADTVGRFPLYFPELADRVDKTLRTVADRDHRGVTGYATGGFVAFWMAAKYPDLIGSATSFMGATEAAAGPTGFDVEYNLADLYANYDALRTRLVTWTRDGTQFYHRQLNAIWNFAGSHHETEDFDSAQNASAIARTLDFHLHAFANPLPKPAVFNHADVYPNFKVWGWEVVSNRRRPAFTVLENVSAAGFRCAVREWIPGGAAVPEVKLSLASPPLFPQGTTHAVRYLRLRDGQQRSATLKADAQGRLNFELDGDAYEVGIGAEPQVAITGYELLGDAWATAGKPVKLQVKFWNKGSARSGTSTVRWESPNPGVAFQTPAGSLFGLGAGESAVLTLIFTVDDPARALVKIVAAAGTARLAFEVPLFPAAEPATHFQIADGRTVNVWQHAVRRDDVVLGEGNGDGHAAPGESFAVLLPDGGSLRAAELFTNDACVDNSVRASDSWIDYDHTGASARYSLPTIRPSCEPGHRIHMLARIVIPDALNHHFQYAALEIPVWYRNTP